MVDILLAVYNGENYIEKQINSIMNQTYSSFVLWIRDDLSTDSTLEILKKYKKGYSDKIRIIEDDKGNLGVKGNFNELLQYSSQDYCMFCDQDDLWLPDKVEKTLKEMKKIEKKGIPALVFTNLSLIDEEDHLICSSMWDYGKIVPTATQLNKLIYCNVVTGCTMMVNKKLIELVGEIPLDCVMHDHWLALIASSFGRISYVPEALIQYRQHSKNLVGTPHAHSIKEVLNKFFEVKGYLRLRKNGYELLRKQTRLFLKKYSSLLSKYDKMILINFIKLSEVNFIKRYKLLFRYQFWPESNKFEESIKLGLMMGLYRLL